MLLNHFKHIFTQGVLPLKLLAAEILDFGGNEILYQSVSFEGDECWLVIMSALLGNNVG